MAHVTIDFETQSACDLKRSGVWVYAEHPTTDVVCLGYMLPDGEVGLWTPPDPPPADLIDAIEGGALIVAHNAHFEKAIWQHIMTPRYGWPDRHRYKWFDTMAVCAQKALPLALDEVTRVLNLRHQKDMAGHRTMRALAIANKRTGEWVDTPEARQITHEYCLDDVRAEDDLLQRVGSLPRREYEIWNLDQTINERGIRLDLDYVVKAQQIVDQYLPVMLDRYAQYTGGLRPKQNKKMREWFEDIGFPMPNLKGETITETLERDDVPEEARVVLEMQSKLTSTSIAKLQAMRDCVCSDGRARALIQYHAATTGRFAGRLLMPHNFPRGTVELGVDDENNPVLSPDVLVPLIMAGDSRLIEMTLGNPIDAVSSGLRHALVAEHGKVFFAADFSTIEARIVLALAGQSDKVDLLRSGSDIYCAMASQIYGHPVNKKEHPEKRQTGKNAVLGLGFQMGANKFHDRYAKKESMEFAESVVRTYRREFAPKVARLWRALDEASTRCVWDKTPTNTHGIEFRLSDGWLTMRLPSGRKLYYWNPTPVRKSYGEDDVTLSWRYNSKRLGRWTTVDAYGGLLTENAVQGLARDALCDRMIAVEKAGYPIVLTVHDEIVAEVPENADLNGMVEIMLEREDWLKYLDVPIAVEPWRGDRYRK